MNGPLQKEVEELAEYLGYGEAHTPGLLEAPGLAQRRIELLKSEVAKLRHELREQRYSTSVG